MLIPKVHQDITLEAVTTFLNEFFAVEENEHDANGIYVNSDRAIQRIGLALEPETQLGAWVERHQLNAIFLHRPWKLSRDELPPDIGIFSYHLRFDERLSIGYNPRLADALGLKEIEILKRPDGKIIGMIGNKITPQPFNSERNSMIEQIQSIFGGYEKIHPPKQGLVARVAVVGAMNENLVTQAVERGAQAYITGQWRSQAEKAIAHSDIGIIAVGHKRSELWGLRALAGVLRERWANLDVIILE